MNKNEKKNYFDAREYVNRQLAIRTDQALQEKNKQFALEHEKDSRAQLIAYVSLSKNAEFMVGAETSKVMAMVPVTVPYFDLANYDLEKYYFVSETYEGDGSGGPSSNLTPGTSEYAAGKVTLLHLYIYITEVFYYGEPAETAGSGYLKEEGLLGNAVFDIQGETGSAFLSQFWDGGYNLQYYVNHVYPLASDGWGSTCDQILLHNGDIVTLGNFTSMDFYNDSTAVFNYIKAEDDQTSVTYGEELKISILRAGKDPEDPYSYNTVSLPVTSCPSVYYCPVNDVPNKSVTEWEYLGNANEDGSFTLDTQKLPASDEDVTYMIAIPGQYGSEFTDAICSTPGGMLLTVEAAESEDDVAVDISKLNGTLNEENISFSGDTMTIAPAENTPACVVLVKDGETYTRIEATQNGDKYDFDVSALPEGASVVVAVKGDLNGNGAIDPSEVGQIKAAQLQKLTTLNALQNLIADFDGDGTIEPTEVGQMKAAQLKKLALTW